MNIAIGRDENYIYFYEECFLLELMIPLQISLITFSHGIIVME
ncbi:hypothetical protein MPTP_1592 [Melissococcus plutonius ATCC 35311]|uniref:Uncharacterized protein n=1 Tax=Melissococcus plutonius (strain ATCC 35311 / DSM 29964 / CIP 104052 / LMG 20360 / NCIMB 702443) TaxID=940190 RepID=F3YBZ2_MELPT|nr:hypothetical protein MPTP_1592 [Melissococcus plutonius ATCC 35311]